MERYLLFCINDNGGALITEVDVNSNTLTLDPNVPEIELKPGRKILVGGVEQTVPGGMECRLIDPEAVDTPEGLPSSGQDGDVCMVRSYNSAVKIRDNYGDEIEYPQKIMLCLCIDMVNGS